MGIFDSVILDGQRKSITTVPDLSRGNFVNIFVCEGRSNYMTVNQ